MEICQDCCRQRTLSPEWFVARGIGGAFKYRCPRLFRKYLKHIKYEIKLHTIS